jgi:hypothetical protein
MRPLYAARVDDLGPGDFVRIECAWGHIERLTAAMLTTAGVMPDIKVQDLGKRMRCRECDEKGRAVISIRWATDAGKPRARPRPPPPRCNQRSAPSLSSLSRLGNNCPSPSRIG